MSQVTKLSLVLLVSINAISAAPQNYNSGIGGAAAILDSSNGIINGGFINNGHQQQTGGASGGGFIGGNSKGGGNSGYDISMGTTDGCPSGQARKADGTCAEPMVTRNIYLYAAPPPHKVKVNPAKHMPTPKVHYNFVFVRTPEVNGGMGPVVAPLPKQKTLVYVLSKRPDAQQQQVIEMPMTPTKPEVIFVNYNDGDNQELPGGIDLQTALSQSQHQGRFVDTASSQGNAGSAKGSIADVHGGAQASNGNAYSQ